MAHPQLASNLRESTSTRTRTYESFVKNSTAHIVRSLARHQSIALSRPSIHRSQMRVIKPPHSIEHSSDERLVFLAGTIDMGSGVDWQSELQRELADLEHVVLLNPRRDAWDSSWRQSIDNEQFRGQVEWELDGLERASIVVMYFAPGSQSPISLLELGLQARVSHERVVVVCPEGFWRKGNVDIVCARWNIKQLESLAHLSAYLRERLAAPMECDAAITSDSRAKSSAPYPTQLRQQLQHQHQHQHQQQQVQATSGWSAIVPAALLLGFGLGWLWRSVCDD